MASLRRCCGLIRRKVILHRFTVTVKISSFSRAGLGFPTWNEWNYVWFPTCRHKSSGYLLVAHFLWYESVLHDSECRHSSSSSLLCKFFTCCRWEILWRLGLFIRVAQESRAFSAVAGCMRCVSVPSSFLCRWKGSHKNYTTVCIWDTKWMRKIPHHNRFTALFSGPPGWAGARRELLDFMVQGKINRGRHTDHPAGRHTPSRLTSAHLHQPSIFLQAGCPSCRPTNSVKALKATSAFGLRRRR